MKHLLLLILIIFLSGCNDKQLKKIKEESSKKIEDNRFRYFLDYDKVDTFNIKYKKIRVLDRKTDKILQTIDLSSNDGEIPNNIEFFTVKDINFDGLNDIELVNNVYAYSTTSSFWIFDKKIGKFVLNPKMNEIENPVVIKEKKEICSYWHDGLDSFNLLKYSWQGDSLFVKEKYEEEWLADGKGHLKTLKYEDGKYKIHEQEIKQRIVENMKCE